MDREAVFNALFARATAVAWGDPPARFAYAARRVRLYPDLPALPALCQAEHDETHVATAGLYPKRTLGAAWMIHHATADPQATPASVNNAILDAVEAQLSPDSADGCCTLGGLVAHCWIEGEVFKDPGDLDGQALLIVPIRMLVP
jgi:hypothetical protein